MSALLAKAVAAAASLTGKKFALMVASSLVATTGILAAALTGGNDLGPLAGLVGRSLAANEAPARTEPAAEPEETAAESAGGSAQPASGGGASSPVSLPQPTPSEASEAPTPAAKEKATPEEPSPEPGPIQHVFVISVASSGYEAAFGSAPQMPYLATTLRPQGLLLSGYSLLDNAALPNSIATVSGQPPNPQTIADCPTYTAFPAGAKADKSGIVSGSGCVYPVETLTLADQLVGAQLKWHAYMEGMTDETGQPDNCVQPEPDAAETPVTGGYASRLNPFIYFHSLLDLGDCAENDVPLAELDKDLQKIETTPNFSYVSPNLCNVGISGQCPAGAPDGAAAADAFLASVVPKILASPAYKKDGLLIVNFGQVNTAAPVDPAAPVAADPLKVGALALSRLVAPGATDAIAYDPYSLLRTFEDLFNLSPLGAAGGSKVKSLAPALVGGGETAAGD
ncbi:MAG TPA: alkaline phosphatase family protein [Solirubrobacterales bacterium]|nr:alkaline phosphatase family protein [Solirubrobacterales bacterium]